MSDIISADYRKMCEEVKQRYQQQNHYEADHEQLDDFKDKELQLYAEIDEINHKYDLLKQSRAHSRSYAYDQSQQEDCQVDDGQDNFVKIDDYEQESTQNINLSTYSTYSRIHTKVCFT